MQHCNFLPISCTGTELLAACIELLKNLNRQTTHLNPNIDCYYSYYAVAMRFKNVFTNRQWAASRSEYFSSRRKDSNTDQ